jgi:hypothetical protein
MLEASSTTLTRPGPDSAIVNDDLALHGAILVVANIVALLVGCPCYGCGLVLDLPLQLEEILGV